MHKPRVATIADAVVSMIAAETWSLPFDPVRRYVVKYTPQELEELRVTVMILNTARVLAYGKRVVHSFLDIGIQQAVSADDNDTIDALVYLSDEITDFFAADSVIKGKRSVSGNDTAKVLEANNDPIYSVEDLKNKSQFFSHVNLEIIEVTSV